jgi:ABC-type polysaccharide/polyol phosphate export permease
MSASSPRPDSYEFTPEQNRTIKELANAMKWVAAPLLLVGVMYLILAFLAIPKLLANWHDLPAVVALLLAGLIWFVLGQWISRSSEAFDKVVGTQGQDIGNLMTALEFLRNGFSLLSLFVKVYVALVFVALIAGALVFVFFRPG